MKKLLMIGVIVAIIAITSMVVYVIAIESISSEIILETTQTVIGQDIVYPLGDAKITSKIVTIPVGAETGYHMHQYPLYAYVIKGDIQVDYDRFESHIYTTDDSFIEAVNHMHNGKNIGDIPAKVLVVVIGEQ